MDKHQELAERTMAQPFSALEVVMAFNTASSRKHWKATLNSQGKPSVIFQDVHAGMIRLIFIPGDNVWLVQFKQAVASFSSYCNAIARAYVSVTQALQAGGIPIVAPERLEQVEIVIKHGGLGNMVSVKVENFSLDTIDDTITEDTDD